MRLCLLLVLCGTQLVAQQQFDSARQLERQLSSDIRTSKSDKRAVREDEQSIPPRIQNLLLSGILALLNSGGTAADVQRKIESVLADSTPAEPGTVGVLAFGGNRSSAIVVAYGIPFCVMCDRTWLGTYEKTAGTYSNTHAINRVLEDHTIYLHRLPANGGKQRFELV
jgi:hypothetical protein